jgi:hypothetical protein
MQYPTKVNHGLDPRLAYQKHNQSVNLGTRKVLEERLKIFALCK